MFNKFPLYAYADLYAHQIYKENWKKYLVICLSTYILNDTNNQHKLILLSHGEDHADLNYVRRFE